MNAKHNHLKAGERVIMRSKGGQYLVGTIVEAKDIEVKANKLLIESVYDRHEQSSKGLSADTSLAFGVNTGDADSQWIKKPSGFYATNRLNVAIDEDLELIGSVLIGPNGDTHIQSERFCYRHLAESESSSSLNVAASFIWDAGSIDFGSVIPGSFEFNYHTASQSGTTHATVAGSRYDSQCACSGMNGLSATTANNACSASCYIDSLDIKDLEHSDDLNQLNRNLDTVQTRSAKHSSHVRVYVPVADVVDIWKGLKEGFGKRSIADLDAAIHSSLIQESSEGDVCEDAQSEDVRVGVNESTIDGGVECVDEDSGIKVQYIPFDFYGEGGESLLEVRFANLVNGEHGCHDNVIEVTSDIVDGRVQVVCDTEDGVMVAAFEVANVDKIKARLLHEVPQMGVSPYYGLGLGNEYSREIALNVMQFLLDVIGFVPGVGDVADGLNAGIYTARGDYEEAVITTAGMLPFVGIVGQYEKIVGKVKNGYRWVRELLAFGKKPVNELADLSYILKPLGRGSTGRTVANNLKEQLVMKEAMSHPFREVIVDKHKKISFKILEFDMTDLRWVHTEGWEKVAYHNNGIEVHFVRNKLTGQVDDFKFKDKPKK